MDGQMLDTAAKHTDDRQVGETTALWNSANLLKERFPHLCCRAGICHHGGERVQRGLDRALRDQQIGDDADDRPP